MARGSRLALPQHNVAESNLVFGWHSERSGPAISRVEGEIASGPARGAGALAMTEGQEKGNNSREKGKGKRELHLVKTPIPFSLFPFPCSSRPQRVAPTRNPEPGTRNCCY